VYPPRWSAPRGAATVARFAQMAIWSGHVPRQGVARIQSGSRRSSCSERTWYRIPRIPA